MTKHVKKEHPAADQPSMAQLAGGTFGRLRIAMLGHKRIPTREGGVEIVVRELAVRMAAMGYDVDAYNRWDLFTEGGRVGDKWYEGVRIRQVPTLHSSKLNAFVYSVFASIRVLFGGYDVIHYHAIGSCAMLWLPHLFGKKTVVTVHGLDWQRAKWSRFASEYLKLGERVAAKYADEIIVLSRGNQEYFQETYGRATHLIPNGMERFRCPAPDVITAKYGLSREDYVLFLARIVPEKGLHYLLEAFKQVNTHKRLIVAGAIERENPYHQKIIKLAAEDSRVQLVGQVHGREWEELFGNCCLYVLPSDLEGMPMSLLEALGFGRRCLVSDIEENVEAGKGCASLFKHSDVEDLRRMLQKLLDDPQAGKPEAGSATWEDWDQVTAQTLDIYRRVLRPGYVPARHEEKGRTRETHRRLPAMLKKKEELRLGLSLLTTVGMIAAGTVRFFGGACCPVDLAMLPAALGGVLVTYVKGGKAGTLTAAALWAAAAVAAACLWPGQSQGVLLWALWLGVTVLGVYTLRGSIKKLEAARDYYHDECVRTATVDPVYQMRNTLAFLNDAPIYVKIATRYNLTMAVMAMQMKDAPALRQALGESGYQALMEGVARVLQTTIRREDVAYLIDHDAGVWCVSMFTHAEQIDRVIARLHVGLDKLLVRFPDGQTQLPRFTFGLAAYVKDSGDSPATLLQRARDQAEQNA